MSAFNGKSVTAIVVAAILAGAAGYFFQKQQTDRLQAEMDASAGQLAQAKTETQTAQKALSDREKELEKLRNTTVELARMRNEVSQLTQQRDKAVAQAGASAAKPVVRSAGPSGFPPGTYVTRDKLAFAGYGTPEATIQSLAWAGVAGQDGIVQHVVPKDLDKADELTQALQGALKATGPVFTGMQVMAQKAIGDDRVEVMVKVDTQAVPGAGDNTPPPYNVVPMVRINNEWVLSGTPQDYTDEWGKTGDIKKFGQ